MTRTSMLRAVSLLAVSAVVLAGPVTGASASKASIKAALKSFSGKVDVAEGGVLTALGNYKTSKEPVPVETAIGNSVTVLKELKAKIDTQSASRPQIKTARAKLLKGLGAVIASYERLKTAFAEHGSDQSAAETEAKAALVKIKAGRKELVEAAKLLS